ncbi:MAG TPA: DUF4912 domain-containing protein [Rectinemataceae bacterium]|nr:DUF4912 domain-containing protein [Rectinemataceae bacterium]
MTSENFESLSDQDLQAIADRMGLGLPPDLDRIFVVEEIVEALAEDRLERDRGTEAPLYVEDAKYWCSDEGGARSQENPPRLETRYNETIIKALVRDPSWAFALWDISETDRGAIEAASEESKLFLRVSETDDRDGGRPPFFDIPITVDDSQWYINLPRPEARYRIDLAFRSDGKVRALARSLDFVVPRQYIGEISPSAPDRRLLELSGLSELSIEKVEDENPSRILRAGAGA